MDYALVNSMHITSSVFINDDEKGLHSDFETWLEKLAPEKPYSQYRHNGFEDNADAHLKRQIMGREVVVAITNGELDFGTQEQIFYGEFDGMRDKRVFSKNYWRIENLLPIKCLQDTVSARITDNYMEPESNFRASSF